MRYEEPLMTIITIDDGIYTLDVKTRGDDTELGKMRDSELN